MSQTSITIPYSEACERNKDVILEVISPYLQQLDTVLEIGTGTAQHALHFAKAHPHLKWQTSDQSHYLKGIQAQLENAQPANVLSPFELDVNQKSWVPDSMKYPAIYTANTFHIMTWQDVEAFFKGSKDVTTNSAFLFVYGPFKYGGEFTSGSNRAFDASLRSRGVGSAIRDFEAVDELANEQGLNLIKDHKMPANNQCLVYQRHT